MRLGLVGYGSGGRVFHAPFIEAAHGVDLVGVVSREHRLQLSADHPDVRPYDSLTELLEAGEVDAVTITTPSHTRRDLVLEAIAAGVHVVADTPLAPNAAAGRELVEAAEQAGVLLTVYHQRRHDADILSLRQVMHQLGTVWRFHSRLDLDEPQSLDAGPQGGLLRDLGSNLVDQALWLHGPAVRVHAHLDYTELPEGPTDCGFVVCVDHAGGTTSYLSGSKLGRITSRTLRVYGSEGSYRATSSDVQVAEVRTGRRPVDAPESWGYEPPQHWGHLDTASGTQTIASAQGRYQDYYTALAAAVDAGGPLPVAPAEAIAVLEVLDAARRSFLEHRVVEL